MTLKYMGHDPCVAQPSYQTLLCSYGYFHTEAFATLTYKYGAMMTRIWALEEPDHHCTKLYMIPVTVLYF